MNTFVPLRSWSGPIAQALSGFAADRVGGGIEPQRFHHHAAQQGKAREIGDLGGLRAELGGQLALQPLLGVGVSGKQVERIRQRERGCLMAGDEERTHFIEQLPVAHRIPRFVPGPEQCPKQIIAGAFCRRASMRPFTISFRSRSAA